jgi:beta-lactamase class A
MRADGRVLSSRDAGRGYYAASTVKLAVLAALARAVEAGTHALEDTIPAQDTFVSQVPDAPDFHLDPDDVDEGMPPAGTPMPIREVARRMIVVSSNEATNMLCSLLGFPAIAEVIRDAGTDGVRMGRGLGDYEASRAYGPANTVSAQGLAMLMSAVVTGRLCGDAELNAWMISLLKGQEFADLARDLPADAHWGSKSGWVDHIRHDVAFFGDPGPAVLVVAVCTSGFEDDPGQELVAGIGRTVYDLVVGGRE